VNEGDDQRASANADRPLNGISVPPGATHPPDPATQPEPPETHRPLGLTAIGPIGGERKARDWALVLQSMSIWHATQRSVHGWFLLVRDQDYARASASIDRYEIENRDWPPPRTRERPRFPRSPIGPIAFLALAAFFMITGPASSGGRWFQRGAAVADLVVSSEPWRAVTALTLHADSLHVMGNVISGAIFASAVHRRLGPGGGSLAIVAAGVAGNLANALWHHASGSGDHTSIGASTAVFGAVGILAVTQMLLDGQTERAPGAPRPWLQLAAPLVGGLALLGALGASPRADLGAHLFGFVAGGVLGLAAALPLRRGWRPRMWVQSLFAALAAALILIPWQLAMRR